MTLTAPTGPIVSSLQCTPTSLISRTQTTCTVTLSQPVPAGGLGRVSVSSNSSMLSVSAPVIPIFAGSSSTTFVATAGNIAKSQTGTLTASMNGSPQSVVITLASSPGTPKISSLACNPGSVPLQSSTTCTATLSSAAPAQGVFVSLAGSGKGLTTPDSVLIPADASSVTFTAKTDVFQTDQTARITASLDDSAQTADLALDAAYRVRAGGQSYTDSQAQLWAADNAFSGDETCATDASIANTSDPALYQTCRTGNFGYTFPVANGVYTVKLHFAETAQAAAGRRVFNVALNGAPALLGFDIFAQAGGALKALDESFPVSVANGQIQLQFTNGAAGQPLVNSIEIVPGIDQPRPTIRVRSGGSQYTDPQGRVWNADSGFAGGFTSSMGDPIGNTSDPAVYQTQRYGNFTYSWNVPNGDYHVVLKFAESGVTAAGQRLFDVALNGDTVLSNFDVFGEAGGAMTALDKSLPVSITDGKLALTFAAGSGSSNLPFVNAIEIVPVKRPHAPAPATAR
jgi:hypothetical protein